MWFTVVSVVVSRRLCDTSLLSLVTRLTAWRYVNTMLLTVPDKGPLNGCVCVVLQWLPLFTAGVYLLCRELVRSVRVCCVCSTGGGCRMWDDRLRWWVRHCTAAGQHRWRVSGALTHTLILTASAAACLLFCLVCPSMLWNSSKLAAVCTPLRVNWQRCRQSQRHIYNIPHCLRIFCVHLQ